MIRVSQILQVAYQPVIDDMLRGRMFVSPQLNVKWRWDGINAR